MSFLELQNIHKSYYTGKDEFKVLKGINLAFERGEFVSILGESGGGKTTLMNIIGGLDRDYTGDVLLNGQALRHASEKDMDSYRRETIGFIFQSFNLVSHLSILDNVLVSLQMTKLSRSEQVSKAKELLTKVGLADHIKKYPNQLSGGQKQRVAIARALASDPDIIIADEPTGALDSVNTKEILQIMDGIAADGKLVICVTHSQDVANHGTRIVHMEDGVINSDERIKEPFAVDPDRTATPTSHLSFGATVAMALKHMRYNMKRNVLILIGAAIGIFSVVLMLGLGSGIRGYMNDQIGAQVNPTAIQVAKNLTQDEQQSKDAVKKSELTSKDENRFKNIKNVASTEKGYFATGVQLKSGDKTTTESLFQTYNRSELSKDIKTGSKPSDGEILLTKTTAKKFAKNYKSLVGKNITLYMNAQKDDGTPVQLSKDFKVSGIIDSGTSAVTYDSMVELFKTQDLNIRPNFIVVNAKDTESVKAVQNRIKAFKKTDNKKLAEYQITGAGAIVDTLNVYLSLAFYVLAAIAGISLLVSAIMIIVVLYISVSERTKEIGVLRALGVRRKDIRNLFVNEAFFLGLFASLLGIIIAFIVQFAADSVAMKAIKFNIVNITPGYVIFGILVSVIISLLAAIAPAHQAAKLDPVESLSYE